MAPSALTSIIAGALGGAGCTILLQPLETLKTRRQLYTAHARAAAAEHAAAAAGAPLQSAERSRGRSNGGATQPSQHHVRAHVGDHVRPPPPPPPPSSASSSSSARARPPSYFRIAQEVVAAQGARGLWAGLGAGLWRTVPGVGLYFGALGLLRPRRAGWDPAAHYVHNALAGTAARGAVAALLLPLTVVKARLESGRYDAQYAAAGRRVPRLVLAVWRAEGARGLFSGMGATLARDAPFSGLYLALYERLKPPAEAAARRRAVPLAAAHLGTGLAAGAAVSLATHPFDVAKTWLQVGTGPVRAAAAAAATAPPRRTLPMLLYVVRHEGASALWRGAAPRVLRRSLIAAINWTVFEELVAFVDRYVARL